MTEYERDWEEAAQYRKKAHEEALVKVRQLCPGIETIFDRHPVDAYLQQYWDYPGQWYTRVAVPECYNSWDALIGALVRDTLDHYHTTK